MSSSTVRKGQQYCCTDGDTSVWQVFVVSTDPSGILHARLYDVERPYELKTLTCSLLEDPRRYRLLSDGSGSGVATQAIHAKLPRRRAPRLSSAA